MIDLWTVFEDGSCSGVLDRGSYDMNEDEGENVGLLSPTLCLCFYIHFGLPSPPLSPSILLCVDGLLSSLLFPSSSHRHLKVTNVMFKGPEKPFSALGLMKKCDVKYFCAVYCKLHLIKQHPDEAIICDRLMSVLLRQTNCCKMSDCGLRCGTQSKGGQTSTEA